MQSCFFNIVKSLTLPKSYFMKITSPILIIIVLFGWMIACTNNNLENGGIKKSPAADSIQLLQENTILLMILSINTPKNPVDDIEANIEIQRDLAKTKCGYQKTW